MKVSSLAASIEILTQSFSVRRFATARILSSFDPLVTIPN